MIRTAIVVLLTLIFALIAGFNAWTVINYLRNRSHVSAIPLVAGIAGAVASLFFVQARSLWWVPLILDYGSIPMLVYFFVDRFFVFHRKDT